MSEKDMDSTILKFRSRDGMPAEDRLAANRLRDAACRVAATISQTLAVRADYEMILERDTGPETVRCVPFTELELTAGSSWRRLPDRSGNVVTVSVWSFGHIEGKLLGISWQERYIRTPGIGTDVTFEDVKIDVAVGGTWLTDLEAALIKSATD